MLRIPVVSKDDKPISPTIPSKARKMIRDGVAIPKRDKLSNFYIQMQIPVGERIPHETIAGIDPGKLYSGIAVQTPKATLWIGHLILPFSEVKKSMKSRKQLRRARRYRKTPQRKCRFLHRTGHKIPPSIRSNREMEYRVLTELRKIYPIDEVVYEVVKANGSKSFSPVMVGQKWQISRISKILPVTIREGWETSTMRKHLGLEKSRKKSEASPQTHAIDGVALAATNLLSYESFVKANEHGHIWTGECRVTDAPFSIIQRPLLFRRSLHVQNFAKGGVRKRHGGTTTPYGFRKGDCVEAEKAGRIVRGYISGYSEASGVVSVADSRWRRIGQFTVSKVRLLQRSCHLLVDHKNCVSI
jgi:hypothetical protein